MGADADIPTPGTTTISGQVGQSRNQVVRPEAGATQRAGPVATAISTHAEAVSPVGDRGGSAFAEPESQKQAKESAGQ